VHNCAFTKPNKRGTEHANDPKFTAPEFSGNTDRYSSGIVSPSSYLLPPRRGWKHINQYAAVHKQRPVDGSEVHEHDQQNEQVIKESNDPQRACRIKA
jgi:hypothetical protein